MITENQNNFKVNMWLDDIRKPPPGWTWVKTVDEAKKLLLTGNVEHANLDHDLGACEECLNGLTPEQWLELHDFKSMPNCTHFGTGYDLVCWMEEQNIWPSGSVGVHSLNPVGANNMRGVIHRHESNQGNNQ